MTVQEVIDHYGSVSRAAQALGIKYQAIHNWKQKGFVPPVRQWQIQSLTAGALTVDQSARTPVQ